MGNSLYYSIRNNWLDIACIIIEKTEISINSIYGIAALKLICNTDKNEVIDKIVNNFARFINQENVAKNLFVWACKNKNEQLAMNVINNSTDKFPIEMMCKNKLTNVIKKYIEKYCDNNNEKFNSHLLITLCNNNIDDLALFFVQNYKISLDYIDQCNRTVLHTSLINSIEEVALHIINNYDFNYKNEDKYGNKYIYYARMNNLKRIITFLEKVHKLNSNDEF